MNADLQESSASSLPPPSLNYAGQTTALPASTGAVNDPLWTIPVLFGYLTAVATFVLGRDTSGLLLTPLVGLIFALLWLAVFVAGRRRLAGAAEVAVASVAVVEMTIPVLAVFARSGQSDSGPAGLQYWMTENQTYGCKPSWAIQPAWFAFIGLMLFLVVALRVLWRVWRAGSRLSCAAGVDSQ